MLVARPSRSTALGKMLPVGIAAARFFFATLPLPPLDPTHDPGRDIKEPDLPRSGRCLGDHGETSIRGVFTQRENFVTVA